VAISGSIECFKRPLPSGRETIVLKCQNIYLQIMGKLFVKAHIRGKSTETS
jgi:hypothetical protein